MDEPVVTRPHFATRQWAGFVGCTVVVLGVAWVTAGVASFVGGRESGGRFFYAVAAIGSTGLLLLFARLFQLRTIKAIAVVLAVALAIFWLFELPGFLRSPGWQF